MLDRKQAIDLDQGLAAGAMIRLSRIIAPANPLSTRLNQAGTQIGRISLEARESSVEDEAVMRSIAEGEQSALAELYERYASLVMGVGYQILKSHSDAEDLLHDVFIEVWNKAKNYDSSRGRVKTWLVLLARSRAIDRIRTLAVAKKSGMVSLDSSELQNAPSDIDSDVAMEQNVVQKAVRALPDTQRTVLYLNYFEGLSCQEIANRLGDPLGTVKSRLRAAVKSLEKKFRANEDSP